MSTPRFTLASAGFRTRVRDNNRQNLSFEDTVSSQQSTEAANRESLATCESVFLPHPSWSRIPKSSSQHSGLLLFCSHLFPAFLLQNGVSYHLAHLLGITEFILESLFFPHLKVLNVLNYIGVAILLVGQSVRSLAMIHASGNFSHTVAWKKREDHRLVKDGIYR